MAQAVVTEDLYAPLTLEKACELHFRGAIKPTTLLAEAKRGNLHLEKVGRRYFVTIADLMEMRKDVEWTCRQGAQTLASTGETKRQWKHRDFTMGHPGRHDQAQHWLRSRRPRGR